MSATTCAISSECAWCYNLQACQLKNGTCEEVEHLTTWIGTNGDVWNDPTHWSTGQVPQENDHVYIITDGSMSISVGYNIHISISSLTIGIPSKSKIAISNIRIAFNRQLLIKGDAYFNYGSIIDVNHNYDVRIGGKLQNTGTINFNRGRVIQIPEVHNYGVIRHKQTYYSTTLIGEIYNYYSLIFQMQYQVTLQGNITNMKDAFIVVNTASSILDGTIANYGIIKVDHSLETTTAYITSSVEQHADGELYIMRGQLQLQGTSRISGAVHLKQNTKLYLMGQSSVGDTQLTTMPTSSLILYGGTHNFTFADEIDGVLVINNGATVVINKATNFSRLLLINGKLIIDTPNCHIDVLQLARGTITSEKNTIHVKKMILDTSSRYDHVTVESTNIVIYNSITLLNDNGWVTYTKESNVTCMECDFIVNYGQNAYFKTDKTAFFTNAGGAMNINGFTSFDISFFSTGSFNIIGRILFGQNSIIASGTLLAGKQSVIIVRAGVEKCVIDKNVRLNILGVLHSDSYLLITVDDTDEIHEIETGSDSSYNGHIHIILENTGNTTFQKVGSEFGDITFDNKVYNTVLTISLATLYGGDIHLNSHVVIYKCVVHTLRSIHVYINPNFTYHIHRFRLDAGDSYYYMQILGEGAKIHFKESFELAGAKRLYIWGVTVIYGGSLHCSGKIYTSASTNIIGGNQSFAEYKSCFIYGSGNFDLRGTLRIHYALLHAHLHVSGTMIVNGNLETHGPLLNNGEIQLQSESKWSAVAYCKLQYGCTLLCAEGKFYFA